MNSFPGKYNSKLVNTVSKYVKEKLSELQEEIDKCTILIGSFNTPFSVIDRSKVKKK